MGSSRVLFDGTSTDAWRGYKRDAFPSKGWVVENGTLSPVVGGDRVDLVTKDVYKDFDLELEWKVGPMRQQRRDVRRRGDGARDVLHRPRDAGARRRRAPGRAEPEDVGGLALRADRAGPQDVVKPVGEWNKARIVKKGAHVEHWLNGTKIVEYELGSPALAALIADSKFKEWPRFAKEGQGHIVLQHHGDPAWFRNIRITGTPVKAR